MKKYTFEMPVGDNGEKFTMSINPQALPEEMHERITNVEELDNTNVFLITTTLNRKFMINYLEIEEVFPKGFNLQELVGKPIKCLLGEQYE